MSDKRSSVFSLILAFMLVFAVSPSLSEAQSRYDNSFPVRVGIFYGSISKSTYSVSGSSLEVYDASNKVIETDSGTLTASVCQQIYTSSSAESSFESARKSAEKYGADALVYYDRGSFYAGSRSSSSDLTPSGGSKVIFAIEGGLSVAVEGSKDIYVSSDDGVTYLGSSAYRGKLNFYIKGSALHAINEVGMQEYLYGVVPKEMVSSWELEALKAQAIVAKNHVITNYSKHTSDGFNVCSTTHCQVYGGYSAEQPKTNRSVDETEGMIMTYRGAPAEAYFHSSSGGRTEAIGNMWNYSLDYMTGVKDPYSTGTPYDSWEANMTSSEIEQALLSRGYDVGTVVGVKILEVSENDRVMKLGVLGTKGMKILEKDSIRIVLGSSKFRSTYFTLKSTSGSVAVSRSNDIGIRDSGLKNTFDRLDSFVSDRISDVSQDFVSGSSFVFSGRGFGHGIGLSQYGANNMAKEGYSYKEIIGHYFSGVTVG